MKAYREVTVKSRRFSEEQIISAIVAFAKYSEDWKFLKKESSEYADQIKEPSCALQLIDELSSPAVAITSRKESELYVANIASHEVGELNMSQYNKYAKRFATDLKKFLKRNKMPISVSISNDEIGLEQIITSSKAREFFNRYIACYPTSYHPNDTRRLDEFICAVARYFRKRIYPEDLEQYLREDLKWKAKDAEWFRQRVEIGLGIIKVYRKS